ncbi:MAG TPA: M28 family peptidase [Terriglobales bacterium]|nr:M28 family peptidase [Terriglobales bacterium]
MRKFSAALFFLLFLLSVIVFGQSTTSKPPTAAPKRPAAKVCVDCIRAHEEFLASDAMQGRGSATHDELVAATYVASQLRQYGIQPAGDNGDYIQSAPTRRPKLTSAPEIQIAPAGDNSGQPATWTYGKDFLVQHISEPKFSGPLARVDAENDLSQLKFAHGSVVLVTGTDKTKIRRAIKKVVFAGAAAVLYGASDSNPEQFQQASKQLPELSVKLADQAQDEMGINYNVIKLSEPALQTLLKMPEGSKVSFAAPSQDENGHTWNAIGILRGSDPLLQHSAVLLSAHLDHLGVGTPVNGDGIYNGADDDASGTTAVLELARVLGKGPRPKRTVIFALFGSEEAGGLGSTYFREHPPVSLKDIAANLEFEMIGRADKAVKSDTVWLTGWERSNLGPTLAKHGANLVGDPHPDQNFFARSDNYVLAKKGVVAQTVSSYGLHTDYHQPSDDMAHLDFKHMDAAIGSLLGPVEWLVNSSFKPTWNKGGQP